MQRKRGELVPIGEVVADLDGPVQAIRDTSPQALHHFTQADQVNQLVTASETTPDLGFMARMMALCSLPRTNPGNRTRYVRRNGPYTLVLRTRAGAPSRRPARPGVPGTTRYRVSRRSRRTSAPECHVPRSPFRREATITARAGHRTRPVVFTPDAPPPRPPLQRRFQVGPVRHAPSRRGGSAAG